MEKSTLDWIINPIKSDDFLENYYEKKHLLINRNNPNYYQDVLSFDAINNLINTQTLVYPDCRLIDSKRDEPLDSSLYTLSNNNLIDSIKFLRLFSEGATMALGGLHRRISSLKSLCNSLLNQFTHEFQTNIYITPEDSQGFAPHYDTHDVFVLQISGSKNWQIYDMEKELALKSEQFNPEGFDPGPIKHEITLNAGDFLYIPRGLVHDARTTDSSSMHITLGLLGYTWSDYFIESIVNTSLSEVNFKKYIPPSFANSINDQDYLQHVDLLLEKLKSDLYSQDGLNRFKKNLFSRAAKHIPDQFSELLNLSSIDLDTKVQRRKDIYAWIETDDDFAILNIYSTKIELPIESKEILEYIIDSKNPFLVKDLDDILDDDSKIFIIKKLVKEGLLQVK